MFNQAKATQLLRQREKQTYFWGKTYVVGASVAVHKSKYYDTNIEIRLMLFFRLL